MRIKSEKIQSDSVPNIGDIVIIKDELPRCCWRMARIVDIQRIKDNKVRSAEVQLATGRVLRRPLSLLFPLEIMENDSTTPNNLSNSDTDILNKMPVAGGCHKGKTNDTEPMRVFGAMQ
ncbi:uncharacterized protein LOC128553527 [Mercenaria mercenaria]|uniref:uncharacterized protein LOC128553527 n=1 Tax=Mercenaria mercenaria TaxID=6596 RepID=UPI00234ECCF4|nr:uncharacterized protein LOC128553527 [Mercenaria mercenaria]